MQISWFWAGHVGTFFRFGWFCVQSPSKYQVYSTWHYEVDHGNRIPAEAHRVAEQSLRFWLLEVWVPAVGPAIGYQSIDVVWYTQQLAIHIFQFQFKKVAAALEVIHTLHHVNHTYQLKPPARATTKLKVQCAVKEVQRFLNILSPNWKWHELTIRVLYHMLTCYN